MIEIGLRITAAIVYKFKVTSLNPRLNKDNKEAYTILTLGDSITAGHGTAPNYSYPRQLEYLLKLSNPEVKFNVINKGVYGFNSSQLLKSLYKNIEVHRPDFIIVMTGANNRWNYEDSNLSLIIEKKNNLFSFLKFNIYRLLGKLKIYRLFKISIINVNPKFEFYEKEIKRRHRKNDTFWLDNESLSALLYYDLTNIVEVARHYGAKILIMTYPSIPSFDIVARVQREVSIEENVPLVDNREDFKNFLINNPNTYLFAPDNVHPNILGYRLIAERIYKEMQKTESYIGITLKKMVRDKGQIDRNYILQMIHDIEKNSKEQANSPYLHDTLGNLYTEVGNYDRAILEFEKAFSLSPHDSTFFRALLELYLRTGNMKKAHKTIERALQLNPDSQEFSDLVFRFNNRSEQEVTIF